MTDLPTVPSATATPWRTGLRRFRRHPAAMASVVFLLIVVVGAVFAGPLSGDPNAIDLRHTREAPSGAHWLGTDPTGRDVFSRLLHAAQVSLGVGLAAAAFAIVLGAVLGALAGLLGRWVDGVIMRLADIFMSFPILVVIVVVAGLLGPSVPAMIMAIGVFQWPVCGRIVRGVTLSLREQEYLLAARAAGASSGWLMIRHVIPAALPPICVAATFATAQAIGLEATFSFLGLGVQPPTPSWGNMLTDAQSLTVIADQPWLWLSPGVAVALTVLAVNFVGDGLRDAVDPRQT
jgi:ABC-type dipeptide/oligopeptide/nickel transport system permease subunit